MVSLTQYLADVHARGIRIAEHPKYGGVHDWLHMKGSMHAKGRAGDLNYGPVGAPASERPVLIWAARLADAAGLNVIYTPHRVHPIAKTAAAHRDHLHVDDGPITAYRAPGANDALYRRILAERRPAGSASRDDDRPALKTRKPKRLPTVRLGNRSRWGKLLQNALNERGYKVGKADGAYGTKTLAGVRAFQKDAGIEVDGVAGPDVWFALCFGAKKGAGKYRNKVAQHVAGIPIVNGLPGSRFVARWKEIQRWLGVTADGDIGIKTRNALVKKG
jgi:hypothetical protein